MTGDALGISPLGTYGLGIGTGFGDFSSYLPSELSMNGMYGMNGGMNSIFGMGGYGMGGYGMMGMMAEYQKYMAQVQQQIDQMQLGHTAMMHKGMVQNEVSAHEDTFSGIIQKLMTDGDIQQRIYSLNRKIKEGDQDGVCDEYDKLKQRVYRECAAEFKGKGAAAHRSDTANQIISSLYGNIISAREGETHELYQDIQKYGDGAFQNGFLQGFRGDHHERFVDETINHIYGERIDHRSEKDFRQNIGRGLGNTAGVLERGVLGAGIATGGWLLGAGLLSIIGKSFKGIGKGIGSLFKKSTASTTASTAAKTGLFRRAAKHSLRVAGIAFVATVIYDTIRRISKSGKSSKEE